MENEAAQQPQSPAASPVMSRRAREANPFRAMVFGEQADKMIAQGTSVIKLSLGEPDFGAPPAVRDAMREQYDGRALPYTAAMGLPELRQAIADFYRERHDLDIDPKRICVTAGGSAALLLATALTVDPGDDVIVADPSYPCNRELVRSFEGRGHRCADLGRHPLPPDRRPVQPVLDEQDQGRNDHVAVQPHRHHHRLQRIGRGVQVGRQPRRMAHRGRNLPRLG